jgi:solute carrier family 25 protein 38
MDCEQCGERKALEVSQSTNSTPTSRAGSEYVGGDDWSTVPDLTLPFPVSISGLYTGLLPSVLKDSPFAAVNLLLYSRLKDHFVALDTRWRVLSPAATTAMAGATGKGAVAAAQTAGPVTSQHPVLQFLSAFCSASIATTIFQPTEVIKTRLQLARLDAQHFSGVTATVAGASSTAGLPRHRVLAMTRRIYSEDGMSGFFRGLLPRIMKRSLSSAISWMTFEQLVQFWKGKTGL